MPACRTRSWRCATARWAGASPASRCDSGKNRRAPAVSPKTLDWARSAAQRVAQSCGVERIDRATLEAWREDDRAHALPLRRARSRRIRSRPRCRRRLGARRPAGAGDRSICRHARRAHRAGRRRRSARGDDRRRGCGRWVGATCSCWSRRERRPAGPRRRCWKPRRRIRRRHRLCRALRELLSRNAATVVDLSLSRDYLRRAHSGRMVRDPDAARSRVQEDSAARHAGAHIGGWRAGAAWRSPKRQRSTDRPVRSLDGGNAAWQRGRAYVLGRSQDGRRSRRSMAQAL